MKGGDTPGDPSARAQLMHLTSGSAYTWLIAAAARLGIADALAGGPRDAAALARTLALDPDALARFMEALAAIGLVGRTAGIVDAAPTFVQGPLSHWLRADVAGSQRDFALMAGALPLHAAWAALPEAVRTGRAGCELAHGADYFAVVERTPGLAASFQRALRADPAWDAALVDALDLAGVRSLVDVGGGDGSFLDALAVAHPHIAATLFERPAIVAGLAATAAARGRTPAWKAVAGDFLDAVPAGADHYVLRRVLHDWDDDRATRILARCRAALGPGGRVLVIETLADPARPAATALLDVSMLVLTGGRERDAAGYGRLMAAADLELVEVAATPVGWSVLVAAARSAP